MSWVTIVWSMIVASCLTLAVMHLFVWLRQRVAWEHLIFFSSAMAAAAIAALELASMRAETIGQYGSELRWAHLPFWVLIVSLVWFVRLYLRAGRLWLAWSICGLRTLALILNFFIFTPNLNYREITSLRHLSWWGGETVTVPVGVTNPWTMIGQLSLILFIVFTVDATVTVWRRGDRRRALMVGGTMIIFTSAVALQIVAILWGLIYSPFFVSFAYLGIILAMGYELSRDVRGAAQLARQLQASEARMGLAASAAGLRLWEWDMVKDEIWSTEEGRSHPDFVRSGRMDFQQFLQSLHPDDREPVSHAVAKSMNSEGEYESEYRVVLPDQPVRWMAARGRVEFNAGGKPVFMRGISLDITRRKEAEESLRESEARFRVMADHAPVLIWMSGPDKLCTFFNKSWLDFTGRTLERELGNGWAEGVHREDLDHCLEVYDNAFNARQEFMIEYRLRRHDGEYRWVLDTGLPRTASDGAFLGYIGSCLDLTERKQSELEITRQRNELAHLSRVTMLGELSGSLAHELNQPLTAILSNAQAARRFLAHDDADLNEVREILNDIVDEDKRAGEIIHRLRLLLKKGEVQRQLVDVNDVVQEVLKLVRSDLVNHGVTAHAELEPSLLMVKADRVQIQQVLLNLVMNACDAMAGCPAGDHKLVVRTEVTDSEGVRVSIIDRGVGIVPNQLEKIFEPFFTTKQHGMGLGLSVCRTIISAHDGKLWAANNPERGATFRVTLPVVTEARA